MTIDLISRFQEQAKVLGWVNIHNINRIDVRLNGNSLIISELFEVLLKQLNSLSCNANESYRTLIISEFRHLGTPEELKIILEDELQKAGVIIQSQE